MRWVALIAVALAIVTAAAPAPAVPPRVCGRAGGYVIHEHALSCSFAIKWSKAFLSGKKIPSGFTCSLLTGPSGKIPFFCKNKKKKYKTYWVTN